MPGLTTLALRSLAERRLRTLLTAAGIALGTAVLFASLATNAGIETAIDRTVDDLMGRADLRVSAFQERGLAPETVELISSAAGVDAATATVERQTYLRGSLGGPSLPAPVTVLGIEPLRNQLVHDWPIAEGSALSRPDEAGAVITETLARDDGYGLGSELTIQAAGDPERFRVVGIAAGSGPSVGSAGRTVILPIDAVSRIFGASGVTRVDVLVAPGGDVVETERSLVETLTTEPYVLSSPRDLAASLRASTGDFRATTSLIAAVALFVGAFLVFNAISMSVGERVREVGLLRAAGATRGQVTMFVLAGAAVLGVLGSLIGIVAGIGLAAVMAGYIRTLGSIPLQGLEVPLSGAVIAAGVGVLVTLAAALEPAWRAARISPIDALKARSDAAASTRARLRWLVGVFAVVTGAGILLWPSGAGQEGIVRAFAVYALLLVVALLSPFLLRPLGRLAGLPFAFLLRLEERLARGSLLRDRSRAALTLGALTVGLAMIVAVGSVAQNARVAATAWLAGVVPGDQILTSIRPVGRDEPAVSALASVRGVERVTPVATFDLAYEGQRIDAAAVVGADLLDDGRLAFVVGDRAAALRALDAGGATVLPLTLAGRLDLAVGDGMTFAVGDGRTVELRVAGVVERTLPGAAGESMLVGWPDALAAFGVAGADFFAVRFSPGEMASARPLLETEARLHALEPATLDQIQGAVSDALGRVFSLFDGLALVAVIVAALGIVNTLTMNVVERVREIGVLRATGMTRRQVGRMVVVEAGILGLAGSFAGAVTGLVAGSLISGLSGARTFSAFEIPWAALALCLVLGVAASMAAAYYPARLASRLSIVRAVQFE